MPKTWPVKGKLDKLDCIEIENQKMGSQARDWEERLKATHLTEDWEVPSSQRKSKQSREKAMAPCRVTGQGAQMADMSLEPMRHAHPGELRLKRVASPNAAETGSLVNYWWSVKRHSHFRKEFGSFFEKKIHKSYGPSNYTLGDSSRRNEKLNSAKCVHVMFTLALLGIGKNQK